jgi:hypothetical protein
MNIKFQIVACGRQARSKTEFKGYEILDFQVVPACAVGRGTRISEDEAKNSLLFLSLISWYPGVLHPDFLVV